MVLRYFRGKRGDSDLWGSSSTISESEPRAWIISWGNMTYPTKCMCFLYIVCIPTKCFVTCHRPSYLLHSSRISSLVSSCILKASLQHPGNSKRPWDSNRGVPCQAKAFYYSSISSARSLLSMKATTKVSMALSLVHLVSSPCPGSGTTARSQNPRSKAVLLRHITLEQCLAASSEAGLATSTVERRALLSVLCAPSLDLLCNVARSTPTCSSALESSPVLA